MQAKLENKLHKFNWNSPLLMETTATNLERLSFLLLLLPSPIFVNWRGVCLSFLLRLNSDFATTVSSRSFLWLSVAVGFQKVGGQQNRRFQTNYYVYYAWTQEIRASVFNGKTKRRQWKQDGHYQWGQQMLCQIVYSWFWDGWIVVVAQ